MRRPIIAGNWKLNKTSSEAVELIKGIKENTKEYDVEVLVCPVYTVLGKVKEEIKDTPILLGAQNVYWEESGAFTGEISSKMLIDAGCDYVIIGHSERRQYFSETNETVNKKVNAALNAGLNVIMCVGETLQERESEQTFDIIESHLTGGLKNINSEKIHEKLVIAYEPVWAIGTGKTATSEQAEEVHAFIREKLETIYGTETADLIRILYGGSVKPENIEELITEQNIDGGLIGGASLDAVSFSKIINTGNQVFNKLKS